LDKGNIFLYGCKGFFIAIGGAMLSRLRPLGDLMDNWIRNCLKENLRKLMNNNIGDNCHLAVKIPMIMLVCDEEYLINSKY
jgi:hypothetical protein